MNFEQEKVFEDFKFQIEEYKKKVSFKISNENIEIKDFPMFFYADAAIIITVFLSNDVVKSSDAILELAVEAIKDFNDYLLLMKIATVN